MAILCLLFAAAPASGDNHGAIGTSDEREEALRILAEAVNATGALGLYNDKATAEVVVVVPTSGSSGFRIDMADPSLRIRVDSRPIEPTDVQAIKDRVTALAADPTVEPAGYSAHFDAAIGRVVVISSAPRERFSSIEADFPGQVEYRYGEPRLTTRWTDYKPHWGGAYMWFSGGGECTSGFSVLNANGNPRMVTAAHCGQLGESVWSPGGDGWGTVKRRDNYPDNDFALVGANNVGEGPRIYVTSNDDSTGTSIGVSGAADPVLAYASYCYSGARSKVHCGYEVMDLNVNWCPFYNGEWQYPGDHCNANTVIFCGPDWPEPGDSGSPFYALLSGYAGIRGTVIGWDPIYTYGGRTGCGWMERWSQIASNYGVTIKTAP